MKKKNKYAVTVNGIVKLLAAIAIFIASFTLKSTIALLALWTYELLFIFLAVHGSNNKFCEWLSQRKFFMGICLFPSIILAFYASLAASETLKDPLGAFALLLTISSILLTFVFLRLHGGIRWHDHRGIHRYPLPGFC